MPRYKLTIEYDGTPFVGWQRQPNGLSVQGMLEEAFHRLIGKSVSLMAAGRTDAGVHATAQICHVDLTEPRDPFVIGQALNAHLRDLLLQCTISVLKVEAVPDTFHARFSAQRRLYLYRILNRKPPSALERERALHVFLPLDEQAMQMGADFLVGHHDFSTFRAAECQAASPFKTLERLNIKRSGDNLEIWAESKSFLHHQVRNMVGTLVLVGLKKWEPIQVKQALLAKDRTQGGPMAAAHGLYLHHITY